jgi:hypothetical protein
VAGHFIEHHPDHGSQQVTDEHRAATVLLHTMKFTAMWAQAGYSRWLCFDVVFELQLLQVEFMEASEIQNARHCKFQMLKTPAAELRGVEKLSRDSA